MPHLLHTHTHTSAHLEACEAVSYAAHERTHTSAHAHTGEAHT